MIIDDLTLVKPIGRGAFGEVYFTSKQGSKEKYATKKIEKRKFTRNPKAKSYLDNEINILKEINHPNIVKLYDIKDTSQYIYLVTEYCNGGGLSDCLEEYQKRNNKPFPENIVQYLMKQIVSALSYLHNKKILHRDIKLDNILVNFDKEEDRKKLNMLKAKVKMIDFGFARYLKNEELAFSTLGSPINMDPGILRKLNKMEHSKEYGYDEKADIWSLGTICYEMLIGKCTFDAESMQDLVNKVEKGNYTLPTTLSEESVSFLNCMLQYDFKKRFSAEQLSKHKFLNGNVNQFKIINLNETKEKYKAEYIEVNTKMNQSIWKDFGRTSVLLANIGPGEGMIPPSQNIIKTVGNNNTGNNGKVKKPNKLPTIKKESIKKNVKEEFMKVFELINDDFIFIEPKLIPFIPGDDPSAITKPTDFCDDNY